MSQINPYTSQVLAQGTVQAYATPESFGGQIASGIGSIGNATQQYGEASMKVADDQARITAAGQMADLYVQQKTAFQNDLNSLDTSAPDFLQKQTALADKYHQQWQDTVQKMEQDAPNLYGAKYIGMHGASYGRMLSGDIANTVADSAAKYTGQQMLDLGKKSTDMVAANPSNENFKQVLDTYNQTVDGLTTIGPEAKITLKTKFAQELSATQVQVAMSKNPQGFLQMMGAQGGIVRPNGATKGEVPGAAVVAPENFGADKVAPYTPQRVQQIVAATNKPSPYDAIFQQAAQQAGIDWKELKMRSVAESGLNPKAASSQGAQGIMQFTPETAKQWGVTIGDPQSEIFGAARMLAAYKQQAGGDTGKVDMMYYGGPTGTAWGKNTKQYAANLAAVRSAMGLDNGGSLPGAGLPALQPMPDDAVAGAQPAIAGWDNLTWPQKVQAVRQAEGLVNSQLSATRGDLERNFREATAVALTGQQYPGASGWNESTFTSAFGDKGKDMWQQYQYAQSVGWTMHNFSKMSAAQVADWMKQNAPQPGPNFIEQTEMYKRAQVAAASIAQRIHTDPAQYAVDTGLNGAVPLTNPADPQQMAQVLRSREAALNNLRQNWGAKGGPFTEDELGKVQAVMESSNSAKVIDMLKGIRSGFTSPSNYNAAMSQLAGKNPVLGFAGDLITRSGAVGTEDANTVARKILDGSAALGGKNLADPSQGGKRPYQLPDKNFELWFHNTAGNAFATPDGKTSGEYATQVYNNVRAYLVGDAVQNGKNPSQIQEADVEKAFAAVTGGVSKSWRGDNLIVPWGVPKQQFDTAFPQAVTGAIAAAGLKGTALDKPEAYHFVNMGGGMYMGMNGGKPVIGPKGAVVVNLSGLKPGAAPAAQAPQVASQQAAPSASGAPSWLTSLIMPHGTAAGSPQMFGGGS